MTRHTWPRVAVLLALSAGCQGTGPVIFYDRPNVTIEPVEDVHQASLSPTWEMAGPLARLLAEALARRDACVVVEAPRVQVSDGRSLAAPLPDYHLRVRLDRFEHVGLERSLLEKLLGRSDQVAVVGLTVTIEDPRRPNDLLCRQEVLVEESAGADRFPQAYVQMEFGSEEFFRTPLGRATARAVEQAADIVVAKIGRTPWTPRITQVRPDGSVLINGGRDRLVRAGWLYEALTPTEDPATPAAEVEVVLVRDRHSVGRIIRGGPVAAGTPLRRKYPP